MVLAWSSEESAPLQAVGRQRTGIALTLRQPSLLAALHAGFVMTDYEIGFWFVAVSIKRGVAPSDHIRFFVLHLRLYRSPA